MIREPPAIAADHDDGAVRRGDGSPTAARRPQAGHRNPLVVVRARIAVETLLEAFPEQFAGVQDVGTLPDAVAAANGQRVVVSEDGKGVVAPWHGELRSRHPLRRRNGRRTLGGHPPLGVQVIAEIEPRRFFARPSPHGNDPVVMIPPAGDGREVHRQGRSCAKGVSQNALEVVVLEAAARPRSAALVRRCEGANISKRRASLLGPRSTTDHEHFVVAPRLRLLRH
eukprot:scaffold7352_cov254-Pinguiococcus_pyrenoidosus.AAC.5